MTCIVFLLRQTSLSFKCLPANTNQVLKANCFCLRFVCFCLLGEWFFLRQIETIINDRCGPTIYRFKKKKIVKIIGH